MKTFLPLLASVSRSFYWTIRVLPSGLRQPVGLAYLLARTADTVADSATASREDRLAALRQIDEALLLGNMPPDLSGFAVSDPGEKALLERWGELWEQFQQTEAQDYAEIVRVMRTILGGQMLDLERAFLQTAEELDDYTYRVAGCVGEFWTRLCLRHLPRYAPGVEEEKLIQWGISFGKGLQLVNILRDAPADLANGRCYLPTEWLGVCTPAPLRQGPALTRPAYEISFWRAQSLLGDGRRYIEAIRPWRLRLACYLPWALGIKTLQAMRRTPPFETPHRVKVSRREVKRLMLRGLVFSLRKSLPWS